LSLAAVPLDAKSWQQRAAAQLSPVTLELRGKSPYLVEASADIGVAALRIAWGNFLNAGQTYIAPNYILVDRRIRDALVQACVETVQSFFGTAPQTSADYGRIINDAHFSQLLSYLKNRILLHGKRNDRSQRYLEPTLLSEVMPDSTVMLEKIFGPILPILPYTTLAEALDFINRHPTPLALFLFSRSRTINEQMLERVPCGGACINNVILQLTVHDLPLGGLSASGMGAYHGQTGFDTFCHQQSILKQST